MLNKEETARHAYTATKLMKSIPTEQQRTNKKLNFKGPCEIMQTFKEEALGSGVTSSESAQIRKVSMAGFPQWGAGFGLELLDRA